MKYLDDLTMEKAETAQWNNTTRVKSTLRVHESRAVPETFDSLASEMTAAEGHTVLSETDVKHWSGMFKIVIEKLPEKLNSFIEQNIENPVDKSI